MKTTFSSVFESDFEIGQPSETERFPDQWKITPPLAIAFKVN